MRLHHHDKRSCHHDKRSDDDHSKENHSKGNTSCHQLPGRQYLPKWLRFLVPWFPFAEGDPAPVIDRLKFIFIRLVMACFIHQYKTNGT